MPAPVEGQGQIQEFLTVLRRRSWQIILPAAFVIAVGVAFAVIVPKKYEVFTTLELRNTDDAELAKAAGVAAFQVKSPERIRKVIEELKWVDYLALENSWKPDYIRDVNEDILVRNRGGTEQSSFVSIEYKDVNPKRAKEFILALRDAWVKDVLDRGRNQAIAEEQKLLEAKTELQKQFRREESSLAELRRRHAISATQPAPGSGQARDEDPVFERLKNNQDRLDEIELELIGLEVDIQSREAKLVDTPDNVLEEELVEGRSVDSEVRKIDGLIRDVERELAAIRQNHSRHPVLIEELVTLRERRREILAGETSGELRTRERTNPERVRLRDDIAVLQVQEEKLKRTKTALEADISRDQRTSAELQDVYREVRESEERISRLETILEDTDMRYQRASQKVARLSTPQGNPFEITAEPAISKKPTEPNPILIVVFAVASGVGLGFGLALVGEYSKSCFRSATDISRVLVAPVLGTVNTITTRSELRRRAVRRFVIGVSSLSLIAAVVFVTWAWAKNPDLLSQGLRDAIEDLRSHLQ